MLAANHIMIANGCGLILVPEKEIETFQTVLLDYYNHDTLDNAKQFIYSTCIKELIFRRKRTQGISL